MKKVRISAEVYRTLQVGQDSLTTFPKWPETGLFCSGVYKHCKEEENGSETRKQRAAPTTQLLEEVGMCVGSPAHWACQVLPCTISHKRSEGACSAHPRASISKQKKERRMSPRALWSTYSALLLGKTGKTISRAVRDSSVHFVSFYRHHFKCTFMPLSYAEMSRNCPFSLSLSSPFENNRWNHLFKLKVRYAWGKSHILPDY